MPAVDYDKIASDYAQHRQVHPEVLKHLVSTGNLGRDSKVLEVGCGTGNYILALERLAGSRCWGIDLSQGMLAKAGARSGGVHFQLGRAEDISFPSDFFDLVFSVDVIHHVEDRPACFQEAYRVLASGGKVCTVTDSVKIGVLSDDLVAVDRALALEPDAVHIPPAIHLIEHL